MGVDPRGTRQERGYDEDWLRLSKAVCEAPGASCHLCGKPGRASDPLTGDHVVPLARGGRNVPGNVRPAHRSCNGAKGRKTMSEVMNAAIRQSIEAARQRRT